MLLIISIHIIILYCILCLLLIIHKYKYNNIIYLLYRTNKKKYILSVNNENK